MTEKEEAKTCFLTFGRNRLFYMLVCRIGPLHYGNLATLTEGEALYIATSYS